MDFSKSNMSPYAQMIQHGLSLANKRLLELDAALDRKLIFGHLDGTFEEKDAKEFLEEVKLSDWWKENFESENTTNE